VARCLVPPWHTDRRVGARHDQRLAETVAHEGVAKLFATRRCLAYRVVRIRRQAASTRKQPYFMTRVMGPRGSGIVVGLGPTDARDYVFGVTTDNRPFDRRTQQNALCCLRSWSAG
jgi:hypothetical protein